MNSQVKVTFLGGLGTIGRNCAAVEIDGQIMLIDCGILFPDADMAGVDLVLPDFTYLRDTESEVVGVVATHGHEDHIGGLSYLAEEMPITVIGSELTVGLAKNRVTERRVADQVSFVTVEDAERITIGNFDLEFFPVAHSVPNGFATAFHTPAGVLLHSGDFKLDMSPVDGRLTDLTGLGHLAATEGIRLLLCDSTNADSEGFSDSESTIGRSLHGLFQQVDDKRLVVACFASHIHRVQQIANAAIDCGRKIATLGRSMRNNVDLARDLGILDIPNSELINIDAIESYDDDQVCVISTGSQGEPMAALARMAAGDSKWLTISDRDCVILSSHPIPGNESSVARVIDGLTRRGADVIHSGEANVHATGHAKADELRVFHSVVQPELFVPVHGEFRHMVKHAQIAEQMGADVDNILVCSDGDSIILDEDGIHFDDPVPADYVYIDGSVGEVADNLLAERKVLGNDGFCSVIVTLGLDSSGRHVLSKTPEVVSRGWISGPDLQELTDTASGLVAEAVESALANGDVENVERIARRTLGRFINAETRLKPMVVPVVLVD